ncbi:Lrp/AsnC family transcriptional regulator [Denitratisoma oestradiolicum]|uniref:siroheme decarboxylase n=1 Tax=Denitratisoma oestradiolicum TaxID=311182 RepID=A0A6S6YQQ4_9PROT|nr:Lrp/AsnC family transcriptional regulator [Denitratisoma oestradiolicum]TWO78807.1 protein nirH [Denitratisoma oestradiolicum]CAB1370102.1 Protein NirH [Denitratisoma oestradiolicum]
MNSPMDRPPAVIDDVERRLVLATQGGLPLVPRPYHALAETLGISAEEVMVRLQDMLARGVIRRIGAVPNHYALGYTANGMSVWNMADSQADAVGERLGALAAVTHCYRRPRRLPHWPYNIFAMVHGKSRDAVLAQVAEIAALIEAEFPGVCQGRDVLFSSRILKKTGLRLIA